MNELIFQKEPRFYCQVHNTELTKDQLLGHLHLNPQHKIYKKDSSSSLHEDYQKNLLNKIEAINRVLIEIQQSSTILIRNIIINTQVSCDKLQNIIKAYRHIIESKIFYEELGKKGISYTFQIHELLITGLARHFSQPLVCENWALTIKSKRVKQAVRKVFKDYLHQILSIAVSYDENFYVSGEKTGAIKIWNFKNHSKICEFIKQDDEIYCLALGRQNNLLLSGSRNCMVRLWDLKSKKHVFKFEGHNNHVNSVLISQNDKTGFSGSNDNSIKVWNLETFELKLSFEFNYSISVIRLISAEEILVAGSEGVLVFYDTKSHLKNELDTNCNNYIVLIEFKEKEEQFYLGYYNGTIQVWQSRNFEIVFEAQKQREMITKIEFIPESEIFVSSSFDQTLVFWNLKSKCFIKKLDFHYEIPYIYFEKKSNYLVVFSSFEITKLSLKFYEKDEIINFVKNFSALTVSSNLMYLAMASYKVYLIDIERNKIICKSVRFNDRISNLVISKQVSFVGCLDDIGILTILSFPSLSFLQKLDFNSAKMKLSIFSENEMLVACSDNKETLIIYSFEQKKAVFNKQDVSVNNAVFFLNDKGFIYSTNDTIYILNELYEKIRFMNFHNIYNLILTEDGLNLLMEIKISSWSCLKLDNFELILEDNKKKDIKKWLKYQQDASSLAKIYYNISA